MTQQTSMKQENIPLRKPALDILESEDGYRLLMDFPGVTRDNLDIDLTNRELTVKGQRLQTGSDMEHQIDSYFEPCSFQRTVRLGEEIDLTNIKANFQKGVLEMHLPRIPEVQPRRIEIQAN